MQGWGDRPALFWRGANYSYSQFLTMVETWGERLPSMGISEGTVCGVYGDYSPQTCSLLFALMKAKAISVPFTPAVETQMPEFVSIAGVERLIRFDDEDKWDTQTFTDSGRNRLVDSFLEKKHPGLIVFTSGSTGDPKGILHDCERVVRKFLEPRKPWRAVMFLLMDHFGGFNTLLGSFGYGGTAVCPDRRMPVQVCRLIEKSQATLLPTTPTFLNLLIASGSWKNYDLSSVEMITYGTEVASEAVLRRIKEAFPNARLKQTYGLSELGVLRSDSLSNDSTWVKIGGNGFEVKVVDGILWVRAESNMVGYINAEQPFDDEGWMCTEDQVETNGDYVRFLGRRSEIINVGGQKVFPAEVENVLLKAPNITEATIHGIRHALLGQSIVASVSLKEPEDAEKLTIRLRAHCREHLVRYKVPMRFKITSEDEQRNERFKKLRK
jgi:long-chain acyl-CoA synthetase